MSHAHMWFILPLTPDLREKEEICYRCPEADSPGAEKLGCFQWMSHSYISASL